MYRKVAVTERLPELMKFVTTIDTDNEHRVYRLTDHGWNMRDADGDNSPNNNLPITHWLEEIEDRVIEEFGELIDLIDDLSCALEIPLSDACHMEGLKNNLPAKVKGFKKIFAEITGENPWD